MAYIIPGRYPSSVSTRSIQNSTCIVPERKLHNHTNNNELTTNPKYEKKRRSRERKRERESEYTTAITEENTNGR